MTLNFLDKYFTPNQKDKDLRLVNSDEKGEVVFQKNDFLRFGAGFKITFVALIFFELLSLLGYLEPIIGQATFFIIVFTTLVLSLIKLEYGFYIILAELFVASKGYLFYLDADGLLISLRIALFLILISVWLAKVVVYYFKNRTAGPYLKIRKSDLFKWYFLIFVFLVWGVINAIARQNGFNNIFFDINGWLYFGLILVFFDVVISAEQITNVIQVFFASVLFLSAKTFVLLFIFSHQMIERISIYGWLRNATLAEITDMGNGFYRIFSQSQIYILIAFFVLASFIYAQFKENLSFKKVIKNNFPLFILDILFLAAIIVSLSRSFWVGLVAGLIIFLLIIIFCQKTKITFILKLFGYYLTIAVLGFGLIFAVIKFPYPKPAEVSLSSLISERALEFEEESAAQSRWNLLGPLWQETKDDFFLGAGFGKTVSYQSQDPRQLERNSGLYTTYAFEWGYLDIWLKLGILGLIGYLILIFQIWRKGWLKLKIFTDDFQQKKSLVLGFLLGIIVICATSIFSPYLNHPLGIGYLMLVSVMFDKLKIS